MRVEGAGSTQAAVRGITQAIQDARQARVRSLMVVVEDPGVERPSVAARFEMVRLWAEAAQGRVRLALVVAPRLLDEERLGVIFARSSGLDGEVFLDEASALAWLRNEA